MTQARLYSGASEKKELKNKIDDKHVEQIQIVFKFT